MDFVFFHNPDEENGYLSNWYISQFTIHDMSFSSMEQYMMYMKAKYFHDHEIAEKILSTDNPATIKALGREVSNYNESYWNGIRQIIIYEGLLAKFSQNEQLKIELLNTQETILAECAVGDKIWGIGLSMNDKKRYDMSYWKGKKLLGYSLMMVRNKIRESL